MTSTCSERNSFTEPFDPEVEEQIRGNCEIIARDKSGILANISRKRILRGAIWVLDKAHDISDIATLRTQTNCYLIAWVLKHYRGDVENYEDGSKVSYLLRNVMEPMEGEASSTNRLFLRRAREICDTLHLEIVESYN